MAANSCLLILILELVFSLTTVSSSPLTDIIVSRPIAEKISNAVGKLNLSKETKVAFLKQYINVGNYTKDFIELLNTYKTFKDLPISFNAAEIRILTSNTEDSLNVKTLAQLKYYRKGQEIQCAQYVILQYILYGTTRDNIGIFNHVDNMIVMAYKGKFIVFDWLWKLHINLWTPSLYLVAQSLNMDRVECDLEQFRKPLADLVGMCAEHKYTTDMFKLLQDPNHTTSRKIEECHTLNVDKHIHYNYKKPLLPITSHLFFMNFWSQESVLIRPMPYVDIDWDVIKERHNCELRKVYDQFNVKQDWTNDPFRHIKFQQMFIDIFRVKLYCFIWVTLYTNPSVHIISNTVKKLIANLLEISYIEDKTLNQVLTFCDEPNQGQIKEVLKIIVDEVNRILTYLIGHTNKTELVDISKINKVAPSVIRNAIETHLQELEGWYKPKLKGLTLDVLSFFVDGSKNTHLSVFPGN